jgi:hypothetical protein
MGLDSLAGYELRSGSPCIGTGVVMLNRGERDFFGNALKNKAGRLVLF